MKGLRFIALAAALTLQSHAAGAASRTRSSAAKPPPGMSVRNPPQDAEGCYVPDVTDAAGTPMSIMQIPGSVVVILQQVIQDQQATTACDVLRNVSGVFCR